MRNFIEELYYGNIDPHERSIGNTKKLKKLLSKLVKNEEQLLQRLSGEELELFKNYVEDHQALSCEANADSFIIGFRFGASFTYDTFVGKVVPYSDFMEDDKNA